MGQWWYLVERAIKQTAPQSETNEQVLLCAIIQFARTLLHNRGTNCVPVSRESFAGNYFLSTATSPHGNKQDLLRVASQCQCYLKMLCATVVKVRTLSWQEQVWGTFAKKISVWPSDGRYYQTVTGMCLRNKSVRKRALQKMQCCPAVMDAEEFTTSEGL